VHIPDLNGNQLVARQRHRFRLRRLLFAGVFLLSLDHLLSRIDPVHVDAILHCLGEFLALLLEEVFDRATIHSVLDHCVLVDQHHASIVIDALELLVVTHGSLDLTFPYDTKVSSVYALDRGLVRPHLVNRGIDLIHRFTRKIEVVIVSGIQTVTHKGRFVALHAGAVLL